MATIYYPTGTTIYTRVVGTTNLTELHIDVAPDVIFVLTGSFPYTSSIVFIQQMDTSSTYPITASWVQSASYAVNGVYTSSWAMDVVNNSMDFVGVQSFS